MYADYETINAFKITFVLGMDGGGGRVAVGPARGQADERVCVCVKL